MKLEAVTKQRWQEAGERCCFGAVEKGQHTEWCSFFVSQLSGSDHSAFTNLGEEKDYTSWKILYILGK